MLVPSLVAALAGLAVRPPTELPRPAVQVWTQAWSRPLVTPGILEWKPREPGGPAVDPTSGVVVVGTRDGVLHAVGPDGRSFWTFEGASGPYEAAPLVAQGTVYAGSDDGRLYAVDLASGKELWRYETGEQVATTPALGGGLVLVATLQDTVYAVDAKTGAWRWHHRREGSDSGFTIHGAASPAVFGSTAYAAYSDGYVAALEVATGKVVWERRIAPAGTPLDIDSTPQVAGSRVYVAAFSGAIYAIDAGTGSAVWDYEVPGAYKLKLQGERLFGVAASRVLALSAEDGKVLWNVPLDGSPAGDPVVAGGMVLVPAVSKLLWLNAGSGRLVERLDPGSGVSGSPAVRKGRVYVLTNAGELIALDLVAS